MADQPIPPYRDWPLVDRPALTPPEGKSMAFYVAMNIEHFHPGVRATSRAAVSAALPVDPLNHGWRDYGTRVGIWRLIDLLDELGLRSSVMLNADAAEAYPRIVQAGGDRGWAWVAHGATNSRLWTGFRDVHEERAALADVTDRIARATGARPRGWLGPALTETAETLPLLAELGYAYSLGWGVADDQPFPLDVAGGARMIAVPYSIEVNDIPVFLDQSTTAEAFADMILAQFRVLHAEAARRPGAVFGLSLHPFLVGQPFRIPALRRALEAIVACDDVWLATSDEIADWYLDTAYDAARQAPRRSRRSVMSDPFNNDARQLFGAPGASDTGAAVSAPAPLTDRVAAVTGAAGGLGSAFAARLAAHGAHVVLIDVRDCGAAADDLCANGGSASALVADVSDERAVADLGRAVLDAHGTCDILVNNAGFGRLEPFEDITLDSWRSLMAVNLEGTFLMTRALIGGMRAAGWGRVVNVASNTFGMGQPVGFAHYIASKGGVIGLTRALAVEYGTAGITVNAIAPGLTRTPRTARTMAEQFERDRVKQAIPRTGEPGDLAGMVAFLASDDAGWITGQTFNVDGGLVLA